MIVGIDPGIGGGVAFIGDGWVEAYPMPVKPMGSGNKNTVDAAVLRRMVLEVLNTREDGGLPQLVVIEKVGGFVQGKKFPGSAMFSFGLSVGKVVGMVEAMGWPMEEPTPQRWKKVVLEGTSKDKAAAVAHVSKRYPDCNLLPTPRCRKSHEGMAEAVCLAEFGRRLLGR